MAVETPQEPTPSLNDALVQGPKAAAKAVEIPREPTPSLNDALAQGPKRSSRSKRWGSAPAMPRGTWDPSEADFSRAHIETVPLFSIIRAAVRAELSEFVESAYARQALRSEVDAALQAWSGGPQGSRRSSGRSQPQVAESEDDSAEKRSQSPPFCAGRQSLSPPPARPSRNTNLSLGIEGMKSFEIGHVRTAKKEFSWYMKSIKRLHMEEVNDEDSDDDSYRIAQWFRRKWVRLLAIEEPNRTGCLARFINSTVFEMSICIVILLNCAFMLYAADDVMSHGGIETPYVQLGEWAFQIFYSVELVLKLIVHRQFFFWREDCDINMLDFIVVVSGFITLLADYLGLGFLGPVRALRLTKFGKAIRAVRIMTHFPKLKSFLVCLRGSFSSLFWCLVMFLAVIVMFSLFLMQVIASHIKHTDGDLEDWDGLFGSVYKSALTLSKVSTGGEDWGNIYQEISKTGVLGSFIYLMFISFMQFALVNIITGIFVEAAMATLSPNAETRAVEHARREKACAEELKSLCLQVDTDCSGKLTREQFEDGLKRKRIPRLLTMLQLQTHHVMEFFDTMAEVTDDDGQVDIDSFVHGCMQLKGPATNFDLQMFVAEWRAAFSQQENALKLLRRQQESWQCGALDV